MKRIEQLQALSKEHHLSLQLAKKCKDIKIKNDYKALSEFSLQLSKDFNTLWKQHFHIEEQSIFNVAKNKTDEINRLCQQLKLEHSTMRDMVSKIAAGEYSLLHDFGKLLHDHTRLEERQLFPLVEKHFNTAELNNILTQSQS